MDQSVVAPVLIFSQPADTLIYLVLFSLQANIGDIFINELYPRAVDYYTGVVDDEFDECVPLTGGAARCCRSSFLTDIPCPLLSSY